MPETTTPQLTESDVNEYEKRRYAAVRSWHSGDDVNWFLTVAIPALIRDWKALRAWKERMLKRCEEIDTVLDNSAADYTRLSTENATLREQLTKVTSERDALRDSASIVAFQAHQIDGRIAESSTQHAAAAMHTACVEKVRAMRDEWYERMEQADEGSAVYTVMSSRSYGADKIITALESLQVEQEKQ